LLAFKLFVVVVGVDSRWLERSLRAHYSYLLEDPESYLEKIFQIPFTLRRMTLTRYRELIAALTPEQFADPSDSHTDILRVGHESAREFSGSADEEELDGIPPLKDLPTEPGTERSIESLLVMPPNPSPLPRPEALVISRLERDLLGSLGPLVATPRAAKRLVNIYRILRVSVPDDELDAFSTEGGKEFEAVGVLLGVLVGRPRTAAELFDAVMAASPGDDIQDVLREYSEVYVPLQSALELISNRNVAAYQRWAPRVSRFSFHLAGLFRDDEEADR